MPQRTARAQIPDDVPDARDDDIIARQLREAGMLESDPVLRTARSHSAAVTH